MAKNKLFDFLCKIGPVFKTRQIPYFVTGSVRSSLYSQPRMTNDIDLVLELTFEKADKISLDFPQDAYYLPAAESLKVEINRPNRGHANLIDFKTGIRQICISKEMMNCTNRPWLIAKKLILAPVSSKLKRLNISFSENWNSLEKESLKNT